MINLQRRAAVWLQEFGKHGEDYPARYDPNRVGVVVKADYPCTCGLTDLLAALAAEGQGRVSIESRFGKREVNCAIPRKN